LIAVSVIVAWLVVTTIVNFGVLHHSSSGNDPSNYNPCASPYGHGIQLGITNGVGHAVNCGP
jgi:hypothetical protein